MHALCPLRSACVLVCAAASDVQGQLPTGASLRQTGLDALAGLINERLPLRLDVTYYVKFVRSCLIQRTARIMIKTRLLASAALCVIAASALAQSYDPTYVSPYPRSERSQPYYPAPALVPIPSAPSVQQRSAQINIQSEALQYYNSCLNEAVRVGATVARGNSIQYQCYGPTAQSYYNYLVSRSVPVRESRERTGLYRIRNIGDSTGSRCWQKVEGPDFTATSSFGCVLNHSAPPQ